MGPIPFCVLKICKLQPSQFWNILHPNKKSPSFDLFVSWLLKNSYWIGSTMFSHPTLIVVFLAFGLREPIAIANPLRLRKVCNKSSKKCKKQNRRARLPEETKTLTYVASRPFEKKKRDAIVNIFDGEDFSMASAAPSARPTRFPSFFPSAEPSSEPSFGPSTEPSFEPSVDPSLGTGFEPSNWPSDVPSALKSIEPTQEQSAFPSASLVPSAPESNKPTSSSYPSIEPTDSDNVSMEPSVGPSNARTTMTPSTDPSKFPSEIPTSSFFPTSSNFTDDLVEDFPTFPSNFTDDDFVEVSSMPSLIPSTTPSLGPSVSTQPSPYPTLEDCLISKEERAARIFALLDAAGDATKIRDQRTPQGLAADWLINQDFRKECPDEKIVQRWVVAVFYFSTDGESWSRCSAAGSDPCGSLFPFVGERRFLSDFSECEWAGITCNDDDCVTEIEFESNGLIGTM